MEQETTWKRYIIHVDMDAFYASVEQRDNPQLRGLPVVVGGNPRGRGVVSSASYEARRFGIHSAMPCSHARISCPDAVFVYPRFNAYREASRNIMAIFHEFTDLVEPASLDEAYLDVSCLVEKGSDPADVARSIVESISDRVGLDSSAGVSFNKFLAKVGSGLNKPRGMMIITPKEAESFLDDLPIGKFHGVGKATEKKMIDIGILKGSDLRPYRRSKLISLFGRSGIYYHDIIHDRYDPPVTPYRERRSIGKERTFNEDTRNMKLLMDGLTSIALMLEDSMVKRKMKGKTVTLKLKYSDHSRITRSSTINSPTNSAERIMRTVSALLWKTVDKDMDVRLVGISVSGLRPADCGSNHVQTTLEEF